jgi:hypothetical protein
LALAMAIGLAALWAAPAQGAHWTERQVGEALLFGMDCPSESRCVGGGIGNTIVSSDDPTAGVGSWNRVSVGAGEQTPGIYSPSRQVRGVDCPSLAFCIAVTFDGFVYTSRNPTGGPSEWSVTDLSPEGPNTHMYGISCPTVDLCVAAGADGTLVTSTDPAGGPGAWTVTQLGQDLQLRGVSCASGALCIAVGEEGAIVSSTRPLGGGGAWSLAQLPGSAIDRDLLGASCPAAELCVTGNTVNVLYTSTAPTGPAASWTPAQAGGTVQITDVDCPSASRCVAIDNNGDVLTSVDPTGGAAAWTFENLVPYPHSDNGSVVPNGFFGVSCYSTSLCAIGGARGLIFTSTDPFEQPVAIPAAPDQKKKKKQRRGPKRPRAVIGSRPPAATEVSRGRTKIRFRFFAANHAYARGFVCKLDDRPMKACESPKTYRVGVGKHVFKVRAVGWTGLRGKAASASFEVCRPTEYGVCIEKLPPPVA